MMPQLHGIPRKCPFWHECEGGKNCPRVGTEYCDFTPPSKSKPNLYLDVDGVLLFYRAEPFMFNLIKSILPNFSKVFWLSCWTKYGDVKRLYKEFPQFREFNATLLRWKTLKTEAIDWKHPFVWIEDGIGEEERKIFNEKGKYNQYVFEVRFTSRNWRKLNYRCKIVPMI